MNYSGNRELETPFSKCHIKNFITFPYVHFYIHIYIYACIYINSFCFTLTKLKSKSVDQRCCLAPERQTQMY